MKMELLYIENEVSLAKATIRMLSRFGFAVVWAPSVAAALVALDTSADFVGVLSDYRLDDGTGADVFDWMQAHPHRKALAARFVFLSGGGDELVAAALNVKTLTKPIDMAVLKTELFQSFNVNSGMEGV